MDFLEWIDFSQFDLIKYTGKEGSFSTIYSALWMEGPFWNWDEAAVRNILYKIHEHGLIHGHLHGGNILVESDRDIMDARVSDTGLHGPPFNTNSEAHTRTHYQDRLSIIPQASKEKWGTARLWVAHGYYNPSPTKTKIDL
ncbi:hypothetical protein RhiirB3_513107 [Rhizophagus irregularis]|nr:hypothetical protein RhiirB3_513107 [Rhizophagus irregularis]